MKKTNLHLAEEISNIKIIDCENSTNNFLIIEFDDSKILKLYDAGQQCCESRFMRTDDNLTQFVGEKLLGFESKMVQSGPATKKVNEGEEDEWEDEFFEQIQFLEVKTSGGCFTLAFHNESNGYYCGFELVVEEYYRDELDENYEMIVGRCTVNQSWTAVACSGSF